MIQRVFGFDSDYLIIALLVLFLIIVLLLVVCLIHIIRLKEKYKIFMRGKNARSLEKTLIERVKMVDELEVSHAENKELLEQLQQADGSVIIPEVLRPYMNGMEKIEVPQKVLKKTKSQK